MSQENEDGGFDGGSQDSQLVKDLRKQLETAKRERDEFKTKVDGLEAGARERNVKDVLTARGVREGIAKFVPADITDAEAIGKWLEENAEDLGVTLGEAGSGDSGASSETSKAPQEQSPAARARALQERGQTPSSFADLEKRLREAATVEERDKLFAEVNQAVL